MHLPGSPSTPRKWAWSARSPSWRTLNGQGEAMDAFQEPFDAAFWLECALKVEREKRERRPVHADLDAGYVSAQAWGYVVTGYSLAEQALKCLLNLDGRLPAKLRRRHGLRPLLDRLATLDRTILYDNYDDYHLATKADRAFPPAALPPSSVEEFLTTLDGPEKRGSIAWRYSLTQMPPDVPQLSDAYLEHLWEVIECGIGLVRHREGFPRPPSYSVRQFHERQRVVYRTWMNDMLRKDSTWMKRDRLEIWWGPDHKERYDYCRFTAGTARLSFGVPQETDPPPEDMRAEIDAHESARGVPSSISPFQV